VKSVAQCLIVVLLCGCAPDGKAPWSTSGGPAEKVAPSAIGTSQAQPAAPAPSAASYEVTIASAAADRVQARDLCDSKPKAVRTACMQAADAAYDQTKSAAESSDGTAQ
jgi:hypothetical protein